MLRNAGIYTGDRRQSSKALLQEKKITLNEYVLVEGDLGSFTCGQEMEQGMSNGEKDQM